MAAFDRLPKKARQALANAEQNWSTISLVRKKRRDRLSAAAAAALVCRRDAEMTREVVLELYGPDHPQAETGRPGVE
jgi:hypothetical protein